MKAKFTENAGCFAFDLTPENDVEKNGLSRFAMNRTNELRFGETFVSEDGTVSGSLVFGKNKRASGAVPKRK
jgi:hypothetical protein